MIPKVLKALFSIGSPLEENLLALPWLATSRLIVGSITNEQGHYCVLLVWIGPTTSKFHFTFVIVSDFDDLQDQGETT
jgi:hypothetical protein